MSTKHNDWQPSRVCCVDEQDMVTCEVML